MKRPLGMIVPLRPPHLRACSTIVSASEPWRTLREGLDLGAIIRSKRSPLRASVCLISGQVAGFVVFDPAPVFARGGYLRALAVAPAFRRAGVGRLLLSFAETVSSRRSGGLFLCVSSFNRGAQAFYRACGYRKIGSLPGLVRKERTEHLYWKRLPAGRLPGRSVRA